MIARPANTYAVIVIKGTYMPSVSMTTASAHATAESAMRKE